MAEPHYYSIKVTQNDGGKGGEQGRVGTLISSTNTNFPKITVQSPAEFKGPKDETGNTLDWTPEDLFVASAAVCLFTTFVAIAENSKLQYSSFSIVANGKLEKLPERGMVISEIEQIVYLSILKEEDTGKAERILQKAEKHCLIANSMKTKIILTPKIECD